ncbi:MAG: aromatic amino acid hydroxylase [Bdellovibrionales bacterium]|nr:aromatic amino acid hydroxylase [Bdellovibrionales bacterium]
MQTEIPEHLREHIAEQNYELYSAIDHASWRYIMRISKAFFKDHAHEKYITGLEKTGITTERIPKISEMDEKLKKMGWRAVTVSGFIPPSVFLEFQSLSILPIACDMRSHEHLEYTPSPDIVHEAAGHAPIISDPSYASYLHKFGEIARKAIFAKEDIEVYEAIKYLSDIKEAPGTTEEEIKKAYNQLDAACARVSYVSEAAKLSRLGWWSIEYGLVRENNEFKIYGAGLLSSIGESYNAIVGDVKKVPLDINCVDVDYDITKPQPQLFYVEDFKQLEGVIEELAATMAYRLGGVKGLELARKASTVNTVELDMGLQISGVLSNYIVNDSLEPIYLQFSGATQLSYQDQELAGHSAQYHKEGFGTPVGRLKTPKSADKINVGAMCELEFESGVKVVGECISKLEKENKCLIISFKNCTVRYGDQILFQPEWGTFDMGCGHDVTSVFGGAADRGAYMRSTGQLKGEIKKQHSNVTNINSELVPLYAQIRELRERGVAAADFSTIEQVFVSLDKNFQLDWLLRLEILELLESDILKSAKATVLKEKIKVQLDKISQKSEVLATLIRRGLEVI